jgi:hypothetical protein
MAVSLQADDLLLLSQMALFFPDSLQANDLVPSLCSQMALFFPDSLQANKGRFSHPNSQNVFALSIFRPNSTMISDFNECLSVLNFRFAPAHGTQRGR